MSSNITSKVFIIYSRKDVAYLDQLKRHLHLLQKSGDINEIWYDGEIIAGEDWNKSIKFHLNSADIILLMVSVDFFNSEYIEKQELQQAFIRHSRNEATIVPILVRSCYWEKHIQIQSLQILPQNAKPIANWLNQDDAYTDIVHGIEQAVLERNNHHMREVEAALESAIAFYEAKKYPEALQIFTRYLPSRLPIDGEACRKLGNMHYYGWGGATLDYALAVKWYSISADAGNALGQTNLGHMYYDGSGVEKNQYEAYKWYSKAAEQGEPIAQNQLGVMYQNGYSVPLDLSKARHYYYSAAIQNNAFAQYNLGQMYYRGQGGEKNQDESLRWSLKSAHQGYAAAQSFVGAFYLDNKDYAAAFDWALKAAAQDNTLSQCMLGHIFEYGLGVSTDRNKAVQYYQLSAQKGDEEAIASLKRLGYWK